MHRMADIAKVANLYSGSSYEEKQASLKYLTQDVQQTIRNLNIQGREGMERSNNSKSIAVTTRELRIIARDAFKRGLNRQMTPAQFKLLDPRGTHILSPQMYHDKADGKPVEEHIRVYAHIKLIGKQAAIEKQIDVSSHYISDFITEEEAVEMREYSLAIRSIAAVEEVVSSDASAEGNS